MKILKWIGLILAAIVILFVILVEFVPRIPFVQRDLARRVDPYLGEGIHTERIALAFWPGLGISFRGFQIESENPNKPQKVLTAEEIDLIFKWGPLFEGDFELEMISLDEAVLAFSRNPDGTSSLGRLVERVSDVVDRTERSEMAPKGTLPEIRARHSEVHFMDYLGGLPSPLNVSDISIDIEASKPGEEAPFSLAFDFEEGTVEAEGNLKRRVGGGEATGLPIEVTLSGKNLPAHSVLSHLLPGKAPKEVSGAMGFELAISGTFPSDVSGSGKVTMPKGGGFEWLDIRFSTPIEVQTGFGFGPSGLKLSEMKVRAAQVTAHRCTGENVAVALSYVKNRLTVSSARMDFYGTQVKASGDAEFGDAVVFHGLFDSEGIQMEELTEAISGTTSTVAFDTLDLRFSVEGSHRPGQDLMKQIRGEGHMRLEGGELPSGSVIGAVGEGLLTVIPSILKPKREGSITGPTHVEYLEQNLGLRDGVLHLSDLSFVTDDYHLTGHGTIEPDGKLHVSTEIYFSIKGMQKLLVSVAVPIPTGGIDILPPFPVVVRGTLMHPIFLPEVAHIPFMALQVMFSPLKGISNMLFGGLKKLGSGLTTPLQPSSDSPSGSSTRRNTRGARS